MSQNFKMLAKTLYGMESILATELRALGAGKVKEGVRCAFFEGDQGFMYKANLSLRTALRILKPLQTFKIRHPGDLYPKIQEVRWRDYLGPKMTFAVDAVLNSPHFSHSLFVSQKVKDAIVDQFRASTGERPSISVSNPDVRIHLHLQGDLVHLSLDSSGSSLHRRGYRTDTNKAPLNEALAAGLLLLAGWRGQSDFLDPMCGSGTLLIEAAMIACNIPANINRERFGFQTWKDYDESLYKTIYQASLARTRDFPYTITGFDKAPSAVRKAGGNIDAAKLSDFIQVEKQDFFRSHKQTDGPLFLIANPPYGERLPVETERFYQQWGDTLKQDYAGTQAWLFTGNLEGLKFVGLRPSKKIKLFNGSIESRLVRYDIYEGSKKAKKQ
ncbi:MAG: class I SAM-dependent RNA methyltransferase [Flavobacteriaceae bacterium]|nr:MAG: class I SAM-dependent RNA methyltransferase [Flavobacteriaceae bacterium]